MEWSFIRSNLKDTLISDLPTQNPCPTFAQLVIDSRNIKKGDWFIALKGETYDGHSFIQDCVKKGAAGFFVEAGKEKKISLPTIVVSNTMDAYHKLARGWRRQLTSSNKIIALTGSVGKTTCKTMLSTILETFDKTFSTEGNQNTQFSIPKAIFSMDSTYKYCVLEFGARHPGDIAYLTKTAEPNITLCLNAQSAHLGIFGSYEKLLDTKLEIISESPKNAICIANHDNEMLLSKARSFGRTLLSFGHNPEADVCIKSTSRNEDGSMSIQIKTKKEVLSGKIQTYNEAYPLNIAAALTVCLALELDLKKALHCLESFEGLPGRYKAWEGKNKTTIIDDAYNANPDSMSTGLKTFYENHKNKKSVLILGDMLELGSFSKEAHRSIAPYCVKINPKYLITVGKDSKLIADEAHKLGYSSSQTHHYKTVQELLSKLTRFTKEIDVVYVKGSFSIQLAKVVDKLKL